MGAYFAPWEIRPAITAVIAGLTPSVHYSKADPSTAPATVGATWRESLKPLIPERDGVNQDLVFFVDDRSLLNPDVLEERSDGMVILRAPLIVRFVYQLRAGVETADWDRSLRAAWHVLGALCMEESWSDRLTCWPQTGTVIERRPLRDKGWLAVEVGLVVQFSSYLTPGA